MEGMRGAYISRNIVRRGCEVSVAGMWTAGG